MSLKLRADKIRKILRQIYPEVKTQLLHQNPFQLLVATILSAQCTDKQVNQVTPVLFKQLKTPADFAAALHDGDCTDGARLMAGHRNLEQLALAPLPF